MDRLHSRVSVGVVKSGPLPLFYTDARGVTGWTLENYACVDPEEGTGGPDPL